MYLSLCGYWQTILTHNYKASNIKYKGTKQFKTRQLFVGDRVPCLFVLSFSSKLIQCRSDKVFTKLIQLKIVASFKSSCQAAIPFPLSLHLTRAENVNSKHLTRDSVLWPDCVLHFFTHLTLITCDSRRSQHCSRILSGSVRQALTSLGSATFFQMCTAVYELSRR